MTEPKHLFAALSCALFLTSMPAAQADPPAPAPTDTEPGPDGPPKKLDEWPTLKDTETARVLPLVGQFKKADPELQAAAARDLQAIGAGAAPLLFQQVADRAENVNAQLFALFDSMLDRRHAALMARECKKPRVELRRYLIRRLCAFADRDLLPVLQATAKDKDELTAFYAQLGALALRQRDAVAPVLAFTKLHWKDVGDLVATVLPAARSTDTGSWLFDTIAAAPPADQMAGLRLLRYLATKEQASLLRRYLEATDHTVKKEAINTARVLHGEAPMENLSVFQAVEMSKEWLKQL
ncbi:MAG: hypothetical protein JNM25_03540 [Planctomycetes bacterium]|nr:hypothetical protein [Planctomycetota bacterium]